MVPVVSLLRRVERRSLPASIDPYGITARPATPNWTGELVNETTALSIATVMHCVSLIADCVAAMPVRVFDGFGVKPTQVETPEWLRRPNSFQTQFGFIAEMTTMLALHGNAYVHVTRDRRGNVLELINLHPMAVVVVRDQQTGEIVFQSGNHAYGRGEIIHIPWLTIAQRLLGVSPLESQRTTLGLAMAMERHLAQWYGEGGTPSSVLETDQTMSIDTATRLQEAWSANNWRHRKVAVLPGGMRWKPITVSASDMEMQQSREHQVREIARAFRVPAWRLGIQGDRSTYQNLEDANLDWVRTGLVGYMRRIEQALSSLLPTGQYVTLDATELHRPDTITLARAHQINIASAVMTPNEAREDLGRDPYDGGDEFVLNLPGAPMAGGADLDPAGIDTSGATPSAPGVDGL